MQQIFESSSSSHTSSRASQAPLQPDRISRSFQFSTQKYSQFVKTEQLKKLQAQSKFKGLVEQIIDKANWKNRWTKIKTFVGRSAQREASLGRSSQHN